MVIRKNKIMLFARKLKGLEIIIVSETIQLHEKVLHVFFHIMEREIKSRHMKVIYIKRKGAGLDE